MKGDRLAVESYCSSDCFTYDDPLGCPPPFSRSAARSLVQLNKDSKLSGALAAISAPGQSSNFIDLSYSGLQMAVGSIMIAEHGVQQTISARFR